MSDHEDAEERHIGSSCDILTNRSVETLDEEHIEDAAGEQDATVPEGLLYTQRPEFTSEIFKIKVSNVHPYSQIGDVKKFLTKIGLVLVLFGVVLIPSAMGEGHQDAQE